MALIVAFAGIAWQTGSRGPETTGSGSAAEPGTNARGTQPLLDAGLVDDASQIDAASGSDAGPPSEMPPRKRLAVYLGARTTLRVKQGQYPSQLLLDRMRKKCRNGREDLFVEQAEADGTELSCRNGYLPKHIPSNTKLRSPRKFYCPEDLIRSDVDAIRGLFCKELDRLSRRGR